MVEPFPWLFMRPVPQVGEGWGVMKGEKRDSELLRLINDNRGKQTLLGSAKEICANENV